MIPLLSGRQVAWLAETARMRVRAEQAAAERRNGARPAVRADIADLIRALDTLAETWRDTNRGHADTGSASGEDAAEQEGGWSTVEAGRLLGVTERQVRRLVRRRELPARRTSKGYVLDPDDVYALKERRERLANTRG